MVRAAALPACVDDGRVRCRWRFSTIHNRPSAARRDTPMSSATRDVPIEHLCALPLKKRLRIMEALLESVENERGAALFSEEFGEEPDGRRFAGQVAEPSPCGAWEEECRTEIHTVLTHYRRFPRPWRGE
jgi:hypothetical protein